MRSKFLKRFGICLFSGLTVFAAGIFPAASAHYNGDHIDFTSSESYFVLDLIPTPIEQNINVYTSSSGTKYYIGVTYSEGVKGSTILKQTFLGKNDGSTGLVAISSGKQWVVNIKLPYIGGVITRSQMAGYLANTNYIGISFEMSYVDDQSTQDDVIPNLSASVFGAKFAVAQTVGSLVRYTWFVQYSDNIPVNSLIDKLLMGSTPNVNGDVAFGLPFTNTVSFTTPEYTTYELGFFTISNNPEGALLPDADSTTIIVDGLDNLGDAIDTSISAGVQEIESVVLQQTDDITGAIDSQTEAILNYRSNVDMSISQNAEVATKLAEETLINQQIYDGYVTPEYDTNVGDTIDQNFGDGVGFLSDAMQMIFDFGVGNLVLVLLTIGTSLFIIGRSMR